MDEIVIENKEEYDFSVEKEIVRVLDKIRPFIQRDGGDVRLVKYEDGVVYVKLFGACVGCTAIDDTLQLGIEAILKEEIPEVVRVENADGFEWGFDEEENIEEN